MRSVFSLFFMSMTFLMTAQDDAVRALLNRTEIAVFKSQKEILAANVSQKPEELSLAVKYQALAVTAFKSNDRSLAACYSSKAREYALSILKEARVPGLDFYLLNAEEQSLVKTYNCTGRSAEMAGHVAAGLIDADVLADPAKLAAAYKLNLN